MRNTQMFENDTDVTKLSIRGGARLLPKVALGILLIFVISLYGCNNSIEKAGNYLGINPIKKSEDSGSENNLASAADIDPAFAENYRNMLKLTLEHGVERAQVVAQYVSEDDISSKQGFNPTGYEIVLDDIETLFFEDADYSKLIRTRNVATDPSGMVILDIHGNPTEIVESSQEPYSISELTLDEELTELVDGYLKEISAYSVNATDAETLDDISFANDADNTFAEGDKVYHLNTPEGALEAELRNVYARGDDPEAFIAAVEAIANEQIEALKNMDGVESVMTLEEVYDEEQGDGDAPRAGAARLKSTAMWPGGKIYYAFNTTNPVSSNARRSILWAMNEWERKTGNAVRFIESNSNWRPKVKIKGYGSGDRGRATLGYIGYKGEIELGRDITNHTALHELGHTLGLDHEHQRTDRDAYVRVTQSGSNYDRPYRAVLETYMKWIKIHISYKRGWIRFSYTSWQRVPSTRWVRKYNNVYRFYGAYDYSSVMHYWNEYVVPKKDFEHESGEYNCYAWTNCSYLKKTPYLSYKDRDAIKRIYGSNPK